MRPTISSELPAENGTMARIDLAGQLCAAREGGQRRRRERGGGEVQELAAGGHGVFSLESCRLIEA